MVKYGKNGKSHKELLKLIDAVRKKVKKSDVYRELCEEYGVDIDYIDIVPMAFDDLDVSARTDRGCIYFNYALLKDGDFENEDHYMMHELTHWVQQCFGDGPTKGSTKDSYLDNEFEQEGFQAQTEYLSETRNDNVAEKYVEKVLDHHEVPKNEREKRRKDLLNIAFDIYVQKKEAGMFKAPQVWIDKIEKQFFDIYASQFWKKALELIPEGLINNKKLKWFNDGEAGKGDLGKFYSVLKSIGYRFDSENWENKLKSLKPMSEVLDPEDEKYNLFSIKSSEDINFDQFSVFIRRIAKDLYNIDAHYPTIKMCQDSIKEIEELFPNIITTSIFNNKFSISGSLKDISDVLKWLAKNVLEESYFPYLDDKIEDVIEFDIWSIKDIENLINECKKYTSAPANEYKKNIKIEMPLSEIINTLPKTIERPDEETSIHLLKNVKSDKRQYRSPWFDHVTVEMIIGKLVEYVYNGKLHKSEGLWYPSSKTISVSFMFDPEDIDIISLPDLTNKFKQIINDKKNVIRHEIQHLFQEIVMDLTLRDFGLPSKKVRDSNVDIYGEEKQQAEKQQTVEHALRDTEFHTNLNDIVEVFKNKTVGWPEDFKTEYIKALVGEPNNFNQIMINKRFSEEEQNAPNFMNYYEGMSKPYWFFKDLKNKNISKWKIAIKQFIKAVSE